MKKIAGFFACIALVSALMCMCVFAQEITQLYPNQDGSYDVQYQGSANEYYVVLVVSGTYTQDQTPDITSDTILYIDQVIADENGVASFDSFNVNKSVDGTVYIGGSDLDKAELFGHLSAQMPKITLYLPVEADSTVFFQDGTQQYFENAGVAEFMSDDGVVVVNTGYTSQKFYKVSDNTLTEIASLEDALLTSENVGMRISGIQGLRFKSSMLTPTLALDDYTVVRYGHIATAESSKTGLTQGDYNLDLSLVEQGKAIIGEAYNLEEEKNVIFDFDLEKQRTFFTGVMINIPQKDYETPIVFRAYYVLSDGTVVYSPETRVSVYLIAKAIKTAGGSTYTENKEYIDSIVDPIDERLEQEELEKNTVWVDISELFKF